MHQRKEHASTSPCPKTILPFDITKLGEQYLRLSLKAFAFGKAQFTVENQSGTAISTLELAPDTVLEIPGLDELIIWKGISISREGKEIPVSIGDSIDFTVTYIKA